MNVWPWFLIVAYHYLIHLATNKLFILDCTLMSVTIQKDARWYNFLQNTTIIYFILYIYVFYNANICNFICVLGNLYLWYKQISLPLQYVHVSKNFIIGCRKRIQQLSHRSIHEKNLSTHVYTTTDDASLYSKIKFTSSGGG